jgi:HAD superfamily hydrolase (TIGR01484 family)
MNTIYLARSCVGSLAFFVGRAKMTDFVIFVDLDGTLLSESGHIHPADGEILLADKDALIIPATGRPLHSVRSAFARNLVWVDEPIPLPMVLDNGCDLYVPVEQRIKQVVLPEDVQQALLEIIPQHRGLSFAFNHQDVVHVPWEPTPLSASYFKRFDYDVQPLPKDRPPERYSKLTVISDDHKALRQFADAVCHLNLEQASPMPDLCDIFPRGRHKAHGASDLLEAMDLSGAFILAAGDGGNDLELFELAGRSFAPTNSPPHIKERADEIIDSEKTGILAPMLEWARRHI